MCIESFYATARETRRWEKLASRCMRVTEHALSAQAPTAAATAFAKLRCEPTDAGKEALWP